MRSEWNGFVGGKWEKEINVRDFIQKNYTPYDGDDSFLAAPTQNTKDLWAQVLDLQKKEREAGGVLDMDTKVISTIRLLFISMVVRMKSVNAVTSRLKLSIKSLLIFSI